MAHEIDMSNGRANVMVTGEAAWHKLGVVVDEAPTSADAIRLAGLDWEVEQWPMQAYDPETKQVIPVSNQIAMIRSDTKACLGVHTEMYRPLQNRDAFRFMDALVETGDVRYETAGSLRGGRVVWMLARIPTEIAVAGNDIQHPYVLLSNSHDGTQAVRIYPTAIRVVCNNTLRLSERSSGAANGMSFMHIGNLEAKIEEARRALNLVARQFEAYGAMANRLAGRHLKAPEFKRYVADLFPIADDFTDRQKENTEARRTRVRELYMDEPANNLPGMSRTAWAALNAVTQYVDYDLPVLGRDDTAKAQNRLRSMWFGPGAQLKQQAMEAAVALCN